MKKTILLAAGLMLVFNGLFARDGVIKETYLYASKDGQGLYLDRYFEASVERQPCIIFMFGGAFARGTRHREDYIPYFEHLVSRGYTVVSIDYRLGLKNIAQVDDLTDEVAAGMLIRSIEMAVDDLLDATGYVIENAWNWNIDRSAIVLNGSSAGAVTVLQAEYELCNGHHRDRLPAGFRCAGVMSFAGAVLTLDGRFDSAVAPSPILMMHGDADRQVPYDVLRLDDIGFYGSKYISGVLTGSGVPHAFYAYEDYGHEIASVPIREFWEEIDSFLLHFVERKEPFTVMQTVKNRNKPVLEKKDFTIADFLNGNYGL